MQCRPTWLYFGPGLPARLKLLQSPRASSRPDAALFENRRWRPVHHPTQQGSVRDCYRCCVVGPQVQRLITIRDTLFVFTNLVISVCAVSVGVGVARIFLDSKTVLFDSALAPPQKAVIVSVVPG